MQRIAFRMRLKPGNIDEYRRRHDALWPDLKALLKQAGIADYTIVLDRDGVTLFAALTCSDAAAYALLPEHPVMRRWWAFMADIMDTHPDGSPVAEPLAEIFHLA